MRNYNLGDSVFYRRVKQFEEGSPVQDVSFSISDNINRGEYFYEKKRRQKESGLEVGEQIQGKTTIVESKKHANIFALGFSIVVVLILAIIAGMTFASAINYTTFYRFINTVQAEEKDPEPYKAMVVIEPHSARVLAGFNQDTKLPMASTTKIMTAIVAIENIDDLQKVVNVPSEAVGIEGTSIYLRKDEEISIKDLLYGLILASGNDSATALAIITAGSEEKFVDMMNSKAKELGLNNTNFTNPHGLHNENHYTTALDLAKITAYAMRNETFRELVSTKRYTILPTNETKERYLKNKQKLLFDEKLNAGELQITGVKSGFTPEAGRCLVTSGYLGEMKAICVVLNCPDMFEASKRLMEKCLNEFEYKLIVEPYTYLSSIPVRDGNVNSINVFVEHGFSYPVEKNGNDIVKSYLEYPEELIAPITENAEVGTLTVEVNGEELYKTSVRSMESVKSTNYGRITKNVMEEFI